MTKAIRKDTSRLSGECSPETSTSASLSLGFVPIRQDAQDEKSPIDRVRAHRSFVHRRAVLLDRVARWPDGDTGAVWHENGDTASMVLDLGTGDVSVTVNGELLFEVTDAAKFDGWSGIGHTSWVPAQRPSMGVMLNTQGEPRDGAIF